MTAMQVVPSRVKVVSSTSRKNSTQGAGNGKEVAAPMTIKASQITKALGGSEGMDELE